MLPRFRDWDIRNVRGFQIYRDRRDVPYTFSPDLCRREVLKVTLRRAEHWQTLLGYHYSFTVVHISGAENREIPSGRDPGSSWPIR